MKSTTNRNDLITDKRSLKKYKKRVLVMEEVMHQRIASHFLQHTRN